MFKAIKKMFFEKITKSEKIEDILNKLSSLNGDSEQVEDFKNICQEIGKIKAGDIFFTNIIDTLKKFSCKNPNLVDTDFCRDIFSEIIPEFKDFHNHNVDYFHNLTHIEKQKITKKLEDLITEKPSNVDKTKFTDITLFKKAQRLLSSRKSSSLTDIDSSNIEFKDLFLIYSLSNSKEKFDTAILAQLLSDTDCWNSLIDNINTSEIKDISFRNDAKILSYKKPSELQEISTIAGELNTNSSVPEPASEIQSQSTLVFTSQVNLSNKESVKPSEHPVINTNFASSNMTSDCSVFRHQVEIKTQQSMSK